MAKRPFTVFPIDGRFAVETPSRFIPGTRFPTVDAARDWCKASDSTRNDGPHDIQVRL